MLGVLSAMSALITLIAVGMAMTLLTIAIRFAEGWTARAFFLAAGTAFTMIGGFSAGMTVKLMGMLMT